MKKIILTLLISLFCTNLFAQNKTKEKNKTYNPFIFYKNEFTIVIINNKIYNSDDTLVRKTLKSIDIQNGDNIKIINDENSKTRVKHILIINLKK